MVYRSFGYHLCSIPTPAIFVPSLFPPSNVCYFLNIKYQVLSFADRHFSLSTGIFLFWLGMASQKYRDRLLQIKPVYLIVSLIILLLIPLPFTRLILLAVMGILTYFLVLVLTKNLVSPPQDNRGALQVLLSDLFGTSQNILYFLFCVSGWKESYDFGSGGIILRFDDYNCRGICGPLETYQCPCSGFWMVRDSFRQIYQK